MAMTTQLPLRPLLDLFRQNHTEALSLVATCGCCPRGRPGMDYDEEADVLYINFQRPSGPGRNPDGLLLGHASAADHSELDDTDTIRRYQGDRMVGFTILNASQRE